MGGDEVIQLGLFKKVVGNPFTPIPKNPKSHVLGWAQHWAELIGETGIAHGGYDFSKPDFIYLDHGVNSVPGQLNLFGGVTDEMVWTMMDLIMNKSVMVISLDAPMPADAYRDGLLKRLGQSTCSRHMSESMARALANVLAAQGDHHLVQEKFILRYGRVVIGDSHATSYAPQATPVIRENGLTLHGALGRRYFTNMCTRLSLAYDNLERITFVAGSVDIRHHIGRRDDPAGSVQELADEYVACAEEIEETCGVEVELGMPVPVEYEERRIPKTGWHKGLPFYGSREARQDWTLEFMEAVKASWGRWVHPPTAWYEMDGKDYADTHMELSSSVHIAPTSYRNRGGWEEAEKQ